MAIRRRPIDTPKSRLTEIAEELLADIEKDTVDFVANFDDTSVEPVVLPTRIPNLLVNGSDGIAVGMATNIPPHNLTEIVDAAIHAGEQSARHARRHPEVRAGAGLSRPAASSHGRSGIKEAYRTGRGRFMMRAKAAIEHLTKDKDAIIVTEIPYQVNKSRLIERIAELVNDKVIDDISDIRDESDRDGMRIVIELKRGAEAQIVLNQLFKHTSMQESFSMIFLAVVNGQPKEMGLVQAIQHFIDHRIDVVRRRTAYLLHEGARSRAHPRGLPGRARSHRRRHPHHSRQREPRRRPQQPGRLLHRQDGHRSERQWHGKTIFAEGRQSRPRHTPFDASAGRRHPRIAIAPADAALDRRNPERAGAKSAAASPNTKPSSAPRRSCAASSSTSSKRSRRNTATRAAPIIQDEAAEINLEDLIADEQVAVTVSHSGYLKRTPISTYRQQRRGGTGRKGMSTREEDFVERLFVASTHDYILVFTNTGPRLLAEGVRDSGVSAAGKGKAIANLVSLQPGETVRALLHGARSGGRGQVRLLRHPQRHGEEDAAEGLQQRMSRGIIAIGIEKEDELVAANCTDGQQIVFLATHDGMAIRFEEDDVRVRWAARPTACAAWTSTAGTTSSAWRSRPRSGKKAQERRRAEQSNLILSVTEQGYGKRTDVDEYRLHDARRQRRDQRQDHGAQRQGRVHHAGEREVGGDGHQPVRQDHPHRHQEHPRGRDAPRRACACCIWKKAIAWPPRRSFRRKKPWKTVTARLECWCSRLHS